MQAADEAKGLCSSADTLHTERVDDIFKSVAIVVSIVERVLS